jgi:flavin-dependent dehydrogenase
MLIYDALILGGGPAGATAGLLLAKAGWRVAIVEKAAFPRRKVCGEFVSATTLALLRQLGVGDAFANLAGPEVRRVGLFEGETLLTAPMPRASGSLGWGRALGREHLDLLLISAAAGVGAQVWQPWKLAGLHRCNALWIGELVHDGVSREIPARLVIAAGGSWERSPFSGARPTVHRNSDLLAFKAHFRQTDLAAELMPLLVFPGGYGGMVHSDEGRVSLSCCIRRDRLSTCRAQGDRRAAHAVLDHIRHSCTGVREALRGSTLDGAWLSAGPIRPGIRKPYANGVFFTGNAAGEAHPIIAEGISMALQASWSLAGGLIAGGDDVLSGGDRTDEVGRAYAAEWRKAFALRIRAAAVFAHLAMRPGAVWALRPLLKGFPDILTLGARLAGKTRPLSDVSLGWAGDPGRT